MALEKISYESCRHSDIGVVCVGFSVTLLSFTSKILCNGLSCELSYK